MAFSVKSTTIRWIYKLSKMYNNGIGGVHVHGNYLLY